ncbi:hypothetical protein SeLEV6574_g06924 [Synchytrium endobioticum]|uniref:Gag1-like clamp domain-containing protein n=1 Tax=Synchytrium endobioticum TaxID=286115 RepID=A0A507CJI1_9FUNG|nr:hypothetical protein SeLEV6574_g06924 [Synchytrium endobioticum]
MIITAGRSTLDRPYSSLTISEPPSYPTKEACHLASLPSASSHPHRETPLPTSPAPSSTSNINEEPPNSPNRPTIPSPPRPISPSQSESSAHPILTHPQPPPPHIPTSPPPSPITLDRIAPLSGAIPSGLQHWQRQRDTWTRAHKKYDVHAFESFRSHPALAEVDPSHYDAVCASLVQNLRRFARPVPLDFVTTVLVHDWRKKGLFTPPPDYQPGVGSPVGDLRHPPQQQQPPPQ